jgi:hypothetical protein
MKPRSLALSLILLALLIGLGATPVFADGPSAGTVNARLLAETTKIIGTVNIASAQTIAVTNAGTFAVQAAQTGTWTVQPGNTPNTTAWLVTGTGGSFPIPANSSINVSQINGVTPLMGAGNTGTGSMRVTIASDQVSLPVTQGALTTLATGQQAVTTSAAPLPSNGAKSFCIKVLSGGTQDVYFGVTGVTTSTGFPLSPGDSDCFPLSNTSTVFVIAGSAGSTVAFRAIN